MGRCGCYHLLLRRLLLLVLCAAHLATGRELPSYIKPCSERGPNPNECALKNGRTAIPYLVKGDPSIRLLPMDPQKITEMAVDNKGLKFTMSDMTVRGQAKTQLLDARTFPSERRLELDLLFPVLDMSFKYNVSGKVLVLPLDGTGTGTMKVENVTTLLLINYGPVNKDGTDYMKAEVVDSHGDVGHMSIQLEGLFNGDKFLAPYLRACSEKDPNANECALKNGRAAIPYLVKGDPSIKLLPQDPLEVTEIAVDEKGLKFAMRDVVIRGEANAQLQDARTFPSERCLELDLLFPVLDMSFKYNVSGKVLVLPLDGTGTGTMRLENVTIRYKINYEPYKKGDIDYIKATVAESRGEIGHMALNLQNLFNGDKFLGENTNKVLNDNWKVLVEDVGPAMFESFRAVAQSMVDTVFDGVPYRKVILE